MLETHRRKFSPNIGYVFVVMVLSVFVGGWVIARTSLVAQIWLIIGFLIIYLLRRPERYVLAFLGFSLLGSSLIPHIANTQIHLIGLKINPLGLLNGLLPIFFGIYVVITKTNIRSYPLGNILILLAVWSTISLAIGGLREKGIREWVTLLNMIAAYFILFIGMWNRKNLKMIKTYLLILIIIFSVGVLWGGITNQGMFDTTTWQAYGDDVIIRATGFGTEAQGTGELLALAAVACLALIIGPLRERRLVLLFVMLVIGVSLTRSRMASIGLIVSTAFLLWKTKKINILTVSLMLIAIMVLIVSNARFDISSVVSGNINEIVYVNALARISYWESLLGDMSIRSLFIGHGIGSAWEMLGHSPHNEYVTYLYDFGLFGFGLLIAILVKSFRYAVKIYNHSESGIAQAWALVGQGVIIITSIYKVGGNSFGSPSGSYPFWILLVLMYISCERENLRAWIQLRSATGGE